MINLRCYFSFRSPYSWLAIKKLDSLNLGVDSQLEYRPFIEPKGEIAKLLSQMGGESLYCPMSKEKHLYILGDIKRQAKANGLIPKWPIDNNPDWSIPHRVFLSIQSKKIQKKFLLACADQRFLEGKQIFEWEFCKKLLLSFNEGIDVESIVFNAQSQRGINKMVQMCMHAYKDGVFGVPFFIAKRQKFWGSDRIEQFLNFSKKYDLI